MSRAYYEVPTGGYSAYILHTYVVIISPSSSLLVSRWRGMEESGWLAGWQCDAIKYEVWWTLLVSLLHVQLTESPSRRPKWVTCTHYYIEYTDITYHIWSVHPLHFSPITTYITWPYIRDRRKTIYDRCTVLFRLILSALVKIPGVLAFWLKHDWSGSYRSSSALPPPRMGWDKLTVASNDWLLKEVLAALGYGCWCTYRGYTRPDTWLHRWVSLHKHKVTQYAS